MFERKKKILISKNLKNFKKELCNADNWLRNLIWSEKNSYTVHLYCTVLDRKCYFAQFEWSDDFFEIFENSNS